MLRWEGFINKGPKYFFYCSWIWIQLCLISMKICSFTWTISYPFDQFLSKSIRSTHIEMCPYECQCKQLFNFSTTILIQQYIETFFVKNQHEESWSKISMILWLEVCWKWIVFFIHFHIHIKLKTEIQIKQWFLCYKNAHIHFNKCYM